MNAKALSSLVTPRRLAAAIGLGLTLASVTSVFAVGTPEQRRACTPDVYRLCAGEIPNVGAITACLHRHKGSLSEACRAAMDHGRPLRPVNPRGCGRIIPSLCRSVQQVFALQNRIPRERPVDKLRKTLALT